MRKRETYYNRNSKECFKYLALFGIWYLVTLLIIIRFLSKVMAPTPELINVFRVFFAVGIIFSVWSGYKYLSKRRTHKTYYKHPDLKRDALKLIKSNTGLLAILVVLIFAVIISEPLITYLDIPIFILALILAIKGTWSSLKKIDRIDLESDLYCWGLRGLGLILCVFGLFLLLSSFFAIGMGVHVEGIPLSATAFIFPVMALCMIILGIFCEFRSLRRYGYFVYVR